MVSLCLKSLLRCCSTRWRTTKIRGGTGNKNQPWLICTTVIKHVLQSFSFNYDYNILCRFSAFANTLSKGRGTQFFKKEGSYIHISPRSMLGLTLEDLKN